MVEAAGRGARAIDGIDVTIRHAQDARPSEVLGADALLVATPEHLGSMAGPMKTFFDRVYYACLDKRIGVPYALMVCAGTDGQGTIRQVQRIATGLKLRAVSEPLLVLTHAHRPEDILAPKTIPTTELARCEELGSLLAAHLTL